MYVITEWFERYEVNEYLRPAKAGETARNKPLDYVRSKAHGRKMSAGFARMQYIAGERAYEVFGFFQKFLEIAACEYREHRGKLLTHQGKAATAEDLAFDLRAPLEQVKNAISVLTNPQVAWLQEVMEIPAKIANSCKNCKRLVAKIASNETKRNETKQNLTKLRTHARARAREEPPAEQIPASTITHADSSSTSTRLDDAKRKMDFGNELRRLLCPRSNSDLKALWNLQHWADQQADGVHARIMEIARDSQGGRKPLAVFFSRLDEDVGYRPRAEADKCK